MKRKAALSLTLLLLAGIAAFPALAGGKSVTLEGKLLCAKCTLHADGQTACQNALVVEKKGKEQIYYLTQNDVYSEYGSICKGSQAVRVTGTVSKGEDGQRWIEATEIADAEEKG